MNWVKAKERLPPIKGHRYFCRLPKWSGYYKYSDSKLSYFNLRRDDLEWLESSGTPTQSKKKQFESAIQLIRDIRHGNIYKDPVDAAANFLIEHGYEKP